MGKARQGRARAGKAEPGRARAQGWTRLGKAGQGCFVVTWVSPLFSLFDFNFSNANSLCSSHCNSFTKWELIPPVVRRITASHHLSSVWYMGNANKVHLTF
mmetsp:Transcript_39050/g.94852  ORF Transcript_39050/g.94852 Transcript_39050/m.94852 type:complete len:101 (-) Transcript_39050:94-396(-)